MAEGAETEDTARALIHDLHNALSVVINYSSLVLEAVKDRPQVAADVTEIRNAGQQAAELAAKLWILLKPEPSGA